MKIVVTGALGHIGSRLVRTLPEFIPDLDILMIDNMSAQRYGSLFNLPDKARYRFVQGDVTSMELRPLMAGAAVVVHLAAMTDAAGSFDNKEALEKNNFEATRAVAQACREAGAAMIHLSSTSVYGSQAEVVDEDCPPGDLKPQSPYAETKLREEDFVAGMARDGLRATRVRFGTIFGTSPGMRFHTAVNKFCWQAVMGQPLTVWRTAYDQRRPYLDLGDAVRAVAFFIERNLFDGRVYNVVTCNSTVRDVVDCIRQRVQNLDVTFVDSPIMNQLSYDVRSTRIAAAGFRFQGRMDEGVADTVALLRAANVPQGHA